MSGAVITVVQAKIFTDHTGAAAHVPVLLTENGVVGPLLDYMLRLSGRSRAWQRNLLRAVRLLLDYGVANRGSFASERELFASFVERLYGGTVGEDGCDARGLYWRPMRWTQANALLLVLAEFTAHLAQERGVAPPLARLRPASSHEDLLAWAGRAQRKHRSFLGRTRTATETRHGREPRCAARQMPRVIGEEVKAFLEVRFMELLLHGFVQRGRRDADNLAARLNLRDCLITLMQKLPHERPDRAPGLTFTPNLPSSLTPAVAKTTGVFYEIARWFSNRPFLVGFTPPLATLRPPLFSGLRDRRSRPGARPTDRVV